jgi:putative spermidine/putrescine transport system ATP-binding protein
LLTQAPALPETEVELDVRVVGVRKTYGEVVAVDHLDLDVGRGEFFTMLGPSGSGKTTTLRLIAGFERPDTGRIELRGVDVAQKPPFERPVNTVFQDYALFPHMTVGENVAYGLRVRGVGRKERRTRAVGALEMVRLHEFEKRKPVQLSGGQRQRVALARAIVNEPEVLLLDEPLGALDLKLRQEMQVFLKELQRDLGISFIYVTHDQEEALTMSDQIAVFNHGRIEQLGAPAEVYEQPATEFVAGFVGTSNILERDGKRIVIRPERIDFAQEGQPATIEDVVFVGAFTRYLVVTDEGERLSVVQQAGPTPFPRGAAVHLAWRDEDSFELPAGQPMIGGKA